MRRLYQGVRQASSCGVSVQYITQLIDRARIEALQHFVTDRCNPGKVQAPLEKRLYRDLVGRIEQRGCGTTGSGGGPRQPDARKAHVIGRLEIHPPDLAQIE